MKILNLKLQAIYILSLIFFGVFVVAELQAQNPQGGNGYPAGGRLQQQQPYRGSGAPIMQSEEDKVVDLVTGLVVAAADYTSGRYGYGYGYGGDASATGNVYVNKQPAGNYAGSGGIQSASGGMNSAAVAGKYESGYTGNVYDTYDYTNADPSQWRDTNYETIKEFLNSMPEASQNKTFISFNLGQLFTNDLTKDKNARSYFTSMINELRIDPNALPGSEKPINYPGMGAVGEKSLGCSLFSGYGAPAAALIPMASYYNISSNSVEKIAQEQNQLRLQNALNMIVENRLNLNQKCSDGKTAMQKFQNMSSSNYFEDEEKALFSSFIKELGKYANDLKIGNPKSFYKLSGQTADKINLPGANANASKNPPILIRTPADKEQTRVCIQAYGLCITSQYVTSGCTKEERENIYTTNFSRYLGRAKKLDYKPAREIFIDQSNTCKFDLNMIADKDPREFRPPTLAQLQRAGPQAPKKKPSK